MNVSKHVNILMNWRNAFVNDDDITLDSYPDAMSASTGIQEDDIEEANDMNWRHAFATEDDIMLGSFCDTKFPSKGVHEDEGADVDIGSIYDFGEKDTIHHHLSDILSNESKQSMIQSNDHFMTTIESNEDDPHGHDIDIYGIYTEHDDDFSESLDSLTPMSQQSKSDTFENDAVRRSFRLTPRGSSSNILAFLNGPRKRSSQNLFTESKPSRATNSAMTHQNHIRNENQPANDALNRSLLTINTRTSSMSDVVSTSSNIDSTQQSTASSSSINHDISKSTEFEDGIKVDQFTSNYTSKPPPTVSPSLSYASKVPVKDRFLLAKKEQEQLEKERLNILRSRITPHNYREVRGIWKEALTDHKTIEKSKVDANRRQVEVEAGFVRTRISRWEEFIMSNTASKEQIHRTMVAALRKLFTLQHPAPTLTRCASTNTNVYQSPKHLDGSEHVQERPDRRVGRLETYSSMRSKQRDILHGKRWEPKKRSTEAEVLTLGGTAIYNLSNRLLETEPDDKPSSLFNRLGQFVADAGASRSERSLPAGIVVGEHASQLKLAYQDNDSFKVSTFVDINADLLSVVAVLFQAENGDVYLAITVDRAPGVSMDDINLQGVTKIAVFDDNPRSKEISNEPIFEQLFIISGREDNHSAATSTIVSPVSIENHDMKNPFPFSSVDDHKTITSDFIVSQSSPGDGLSVNEDRIIVDESVENGNVTVTNEYSEGAFAARDSDSSYREMNEPLIHTTTAAASETERSDMESNDFDAELKDYLSLTQLKRDASIDQSSLNVSEIVVLELDSKDPTIDASIESTEISDDNMISLMDHSLESIQSEGSRTDGITCISGETESSAVASLGAISETVKSDELISYVTTFEEASKSGSSEFGDDVNVDVKSVDDIDRGLRLGHSTETIINTEEETTLELRVSNEDSQDTPQSPIIAEGRVIGLVSTEDSNPSSQGAFDSFYSSTGIPRLKDMPQDLDGLFNSVSAMTSPIFCGLFFPVEDASSPAEEGDASLTSTRERIARALLQESSQATADTNTIDKESVDEVVSETAEPKPLATIEAESSDRSDETSLSLSDAGVDADYDEVTAAIVSAPDFDPNAAFNFDLAADVPQIDRPVYQPPVAVPVNKKSSSSPYWSPEDERDDDLPPLAMVSLPIDILSIRCVSGGANCLIIQYQSQHVVDGDNYRETKQSSRSNVVIVTGTLKYSATPETHCHALLVQRDDYWHVSEGAETVDDVINVRSTRPRKQSETIFKWKRGAAASGWMIKWPLQSQSFGLPSQRFFVLRGNRLSYYNAIPETVDQPTKKMSLSGLVFSSDRPITTIELTADASIERSRKRFQSCLKVTTAASIDPKRDVLWFKRLPISTALSVSAGSGSIKAPAESTWLNAINQSIDDLRPKSRFESKGLLEGVFYHENKNVTCVMIEAVYLRTRPPPPELRKYQSSPNLMQTRPFALFGSARDVSKGVSEKASIVSVDPILHLSVYRQYFLERAVSGFTDTTLGRAMTQSMEADSAAFVGPLRNSLFSFVADMGGLSGSGRRLSMPALPPSASSSTFRVAELRYSLDVGRSDDIHGARKHYQLSLDGDAPHRALNLKSDLKCCKAIALSECVFVMFGGSNGFLAWCLLPLDREGRRDQFSGATISLPLYKLAEGTFQYDDAPLHFGTGDAEASPLVTEESIADWNRVYPHHVYHHAKLLRSKNYCQRMSKRVSINQYPFTGRRSKRSHTQRLRKIPDGGTVVVFEGDVDSDEESVEEASSADRGGGADRDDYTVSTESEAMGRLVRSRHPTIRYHPVAGSIICLAKITVPRRLVGRSTEASSIHLIAAGDSDGFVSLWRLTPLVEGHLESCVPRLVSFIDMADLGGDRRFEQVKSLTFIPSLPKEGEESKSSSQDAPPIDLVVGTNERLVLVTLTKYYPPQCPSCDEEDGTAFAPSSGVKESVPYRFYAWTDLDRVPAGFLTHYLFHARDAPRSGTKTPNEVSKKMVLWKLIHEDEDVFTSTLDAPVHGSGANHCRLYRFEWSDDMHRSALSRLTLIGHQRHVAPPIQSAEASPSFTQEKYFS